MPLPPWPVGLLQSTGLILGRGVHAQHHARPYDASYCITTGWCNAGLERIRFFRTLERLITALTGVEPRQDDERYQTRIA
jgi:plasmanylethanolamine desaturase